MLITIGGLPGSGTTTVSKLLSQKIQRKRMDAGDLWDVMAKERNTDVLGLNLIAENDPSIDHELDRKLIETAKTNSHGIMESRLIGYFCSQENIPSFKIWLTGDTDIRIARLKKDHREAEKVTEREMSEKKRYLELYDIDIDDLSVYDLVVNTNKVTPEQIVSQIITKLNDIGELKQ